MSKVMNTSVGGLGNMYDDNDEEYGPVPMGQPKDYVDDKKVISSLIYSYFIVIFS